MMTLSLKRCKRLSLLTREVKRRQMILKDLNTEEKVILPKPLKNQKKMKEKRVKKEKRRKQKRLRD